MISMWVILFVGLISVVSAEKKAGCNKTAKEDLLSEDTTREVSEKEIKLI